MIKDLIKKKIAKTLGVSFLGFYLPYLFFTTIGFIFFDAGSKVGYGLGNYIAVAILIALVLFVAALVITIILLLFSLVDNRILNKWFVFGFSIYCLIFGFINQQVNTWLLLLVVFVSLFIVLLAIKTWFPKISKVK